MTIKIPEKHYVTFQKRNNDELPLGFMTPEGTDAAARKRKKTADNWAGSNSLPAQTFDNKLLIGFSFVRSVRRYGHYGPGNVVWRVADPRGFELEISSANMAELIRLTTIDRGEVQSRCIWARSGADNVLVPEESEQYQEAINNTTLSKSSVSARDVKIGNTVGLQNGTTGVYYGKFYLGRCSWRSDTGSQLSSSRTYNIVEMAQDTITHVFCTEHSKNGYPLSFKCYSSPKFSTIIKDDTFTYAEAEERINSALNHGAMIDSTNAYQVDFVFSKKEDFEKIEYALKEIPLDSYHFKKNLRYSFYATVAERAGEMYAIAPQTYQCYHSNSQNTSMCHVLMDVSDLRNGKIILSYKERDQSLMNRYWSGSRYYEPNGITGKFSDITGSPTEKLYGVFYKMETALGNSITMPALYH